MRNQLVRVTFLKKNGEERLMLATLEPATITRLNLEPKGTGVTDEEDPDSVPEIIRVVDVENSAWRSIIVDSIMYIEDEVFSQFA